MILSTDLLVFGAVIFINFVMFEHFYRISKAFAKNTLESIIKRIGKKVLELFERFKRTTAVIAYKLNLKRNFAGFTDEKISLKHIKKKKKKKKYKKYKDMNNIERVRYFYDKKVTYAKKKGVDIKKYHTPKEAVSNMRAAELIGEDGDFFVLTYNEARYNENAYINEETVEKIKKI